MTWEECEKYLIEHGFKLVDSREENQFYQGSTAGRTLRTGRYEVEIVYKEDLEPILICRVIFKEKEADVFYFEECSETLMCTDKRLLNELINTHLGEELYVRETKRGGMSIEVFLKVVTGDMDKYWMKVDNLNNYEAIEALDGCT
jgi:hypothetical protein